MVFPNTIVLGDVEVTNVSMIFEESGGIFHVLLPFFMYHDAALRSAVLERRFFHGQVYHGA